MKKKSIFAVGFLFVTLLQPMISQANSVYNRNLSSENTYPEKKLTIVGGGICGALHAYFAFKEAQSKDEKIRISIYEKNKSIADTTTSHILPSLTPDEILSVIPRGKLLIDKLQILFSEPGGIKVNDVEGIDNSCAENFIKQAVTYSQDDLGHQARTETLLSLGKMSMDLWQSIYDNADPEFKAIMIASNFNPCCEPKSHDLRELHKGYRIDLIYKIPNAANRAQNMIKDYEVLGYKSCKILTPVEVTALDPFLDEFCKMHSVKDEKGILQWNDDSVALWRPGGCIDTEVLLPKLHGYLKKVMGTYKNASGQTKSCFQWKFDREVKDVELVKDNDGMLVTGLGLVDGYLKHHKHAYKDSSYVFCPGEAVGTLTKFGFKEPAYSGFAGASLMLNIPLSDSEAVAFSSFNHCMEVHQEGVVLAWQARFKEGKIFVGVAGTKSFYGDQRPNKDQAFAKNRNLLQLNMINDVLPEFISVAFGRDTTGQVLTEADLKLLEDKHIAERWVGVRACAYDGFPTLGIAYNAEGQEVKNALITTHLGSGGGAFGPAAVFVTRCARDGKTIKNALISKVLSYADSSREATQP